MDPEKKNDNVDNEKNNTKNIDNIKYIDNDDAKNIDYYLMFDEDDKHIYEVNHSSRSLYSGKLNNTKVLFNNNKHQIITANIINGYIVGYGKVIIWDGRIEEGEFIKAQMINGSMMFSSGLVYKGTFVNHKLNGDNCTIIKPNGDVCIGTAKDNKFIGVIEVKYKNGDNYVGTFGENNRLLEGVYTKSSNNIIYEGKFTNSKLNGTGTIKYTNAIYKGNVINNIKEGNGIMEFKDGRKYVGEFSNDKFIEGKKYRNGKLTYNGKYKNDILVVGFYYLYDEDGTVHKFDSNNNPVRDTKIIYALKDTINILKEIVHKNENEIMELKQMLEKYINQ